MAADPEGRRYVTFEDDAGGWNNIRMALEAFVLVAKLTGRTLVLPPRTKMYLLDTGPITAFDKRPAKKSSTSGYDDYYDLDHLRSGGHLAVISSDEFFQLEKARLTAFINPTYLRTDLALTNGQHSDYFLALRAHPDVHIWPSGPQFHAAFALGPASPPALSQQTVGENKPIIHFPMHISKNLRYLFGVPALLGCMDPRACTAHPQLVLESQLFLQYYFHYRSDIVQAAADLVSKYLGGIAAFSAMHVRRNELQYKEVFLPASKSLDNAKHLFRKGERIYIATDETSPDFFKAFKDAGHPYVLLRTLLATWELPPSIQPKHLGLVEQLVCASARVFVGTSMSTFTSYIFRLRRYAGAHVRGAQQDIDLALHFHDTQRDMRGGMFYNDATFAAPPAAAPPAGT